MDRFQLCVGRNFEAARNELSCDLSSLSLETGKQSVFTQASKLPCAR